MCFVWRGYIAQLTHHEVLSACLFPSLLFSTVRDEMDWVTVGIEKAFCSGFQEMYVCISFYFPVNQCRTISILHSGATVLRMLSIS